MCCFSPVPQALPQHTGHVVLHACLAPWLAPVVPAVNAAPLATSLPPWETANAIVVMLEAMQQLVAMSAAAVRLGPIRTWAPLSAQHVKRAGSQKIGETQLVNNVWLVPMLMKGRFAASVRAI